MSNKDLETEGGSDTEKLSMDAAERLYGPITRLWTKDCEAGQTASGGWYWAIPSHASYGYASMRDALWAALKHTAERLAFHERLEHRSAFAPPAVEKEPETTEEVDAYLRACGEDPERIGRLGKRFVTLILENVRLRIVLDSPELLERLAALEHERWAGWMLYQAEKVEVVDMGLRHPSGESYTGRWLRLVHTPYDRLTEQEKESDRIEVRKTLAVLRDALKEASDE